MYKQNLFKNVHKQNYRQFCDLVSNISLNYVYSTILSPVQITTYPMHLVNVIRFSGIIVFRMFSDPYNYDLLVFSQHDY